MIKVPSEASQVLIAKAYEAGQEHLLQWWDELPPEEQNALLEKIKEIDFQLLRRLVSRYIKGTISRKVKLSKPQPADTVPLPPAGLRSKEWERLNRLGEAAISAGEVGVFMAAGRGGSQMGLPGPRSFCPVGPISQKTLLQVQCEKVRALNLKYQTEVPFFIMTSPETSGHIRAFLRKNRFFNLSQRSVFFLEQPRLPLLDRRGKIVMNSRSGIAMAPNGHGGAFLLMERPEVFNRLQERGVKYLFYFQADNAFAYILDPAFLGYHIAERADVSARSVVKQSSDEKLGVFSRKANQIFVIEYSELPEEAREKRDPETNQLVFNAGNMAMHIFSVDFLRKAQENKFSVPYHMAQQRSQFIDRNGVLIKPSSPNCYRFECYTFDVFPFAEKAIVVEADRNEEFYPLRSKRGKYSPHEVREAMSRRYASWLEKAGVKLPRDKSQRIVGTYEISPLFCTNPEELKENCDVSSLKVGDSLYLE